MTNVPTFVPTVARPSGAAGTAASLTAAPRPFIASSMPVPVSGPRAQAAATPQRAVDTPSAQPAARGAEPSRILLWFRTDLRVTDNPALFAAARAARQPGGALVPLFVTPGAVGVEALAAEVKEGLKALGSELIVMDGNSSGELCRNGGNFNDGSSSGGVGKVGMVEILLEVCDRLRLSAVYFNRAGGGGARGGGCDVSTAREEARMMSALEEAGLQVRAFWGNSLVQPSDAHLVDEGRAPAGKKQSGKARRVALRAVQKDVLARSGDVVKFAGPPESLPAVPAAAMGLTAHPAAQVQVRAAGTSAALALLARMDHRRETLLLAPDADLAVSLKTHLDYGSVSPRMVAACVADKLGKLRGKTFSEVVWRTYVALVAHRAAGVAAPSAVTAA